MSKYLFVIFFLFLSIDINAQIDTHTLSSELKPVPNDLFKLPYSSETISELNKTEKFIADSNISSFKNFFFLFLLNLITISVLLLNLSRTKVQKILATLANINMLKQVAKVEIKRDNRYLMAYIVLVAIFIVVLIYVFSYLFKIDIDIVKIGLSIYIFFLIDFIVGRITAYVLNQKEIYTIIAFNNISYLLLLLPIIILGVLFIVFLPESLSKSFAYFFAVLVFLIYIWKEIRNVFILASSKIKVGSFYFFLYLCTFKILPFIILFKVISAEIIK